MSELTRHQGIIKAGRPQNTHIPLWHSSLSISLQLLIPGHQKFPSFLTPTPTQDLLEAIMLQHIVELDPRKYNIKTEQNSKIFDTNTAYFNWKKNRVS